MKRLKTIFAAVLFLTTASAMVGAGCASLEDPGCSSDAECRFGRTCVEGICVGEPDTSNNTTSNNATTNNGAANNATTNNATTNNATTNNATTNNGTANNGGNSLPIRMCGDDADCDPGSSCQNQVCTQPCDDSLECPDGRICSGSDGCVTPDSCDLVQEGEAQGLCVAVWICENTGEVIVACEPESGFSECQCVDSATGMSNSFDVEDLDCGAEELARLANENCQLNLPEG